MLYSFPIEPNATTKGYLMPDWMQYWLVAMVTLNTLINTIVFLRHRFRK